MTETDYDRVDYGGNAQFYTAPNLIAGLGRVLGVPCALPSRARVLELGCGNGANLIPLASFWPDAEFLGIDLAHTPVRQGSERIARLGLANIRLVQGDVTELDPATIGQFDYVIAHGLFSWVPAPVREAILHLTERLLRPMGIAYISYNAYPGCRIRHLVREVMQFHLGAQAYSIDAAKQAWQLLESVSEVPATERPPFFTTLADESRSAMSAGVNFLFHDDLSPNNQPFYLHEFAAMAQRAGLSYLGDADPDAMFEGAGAPGITAWLDRMSGGDWMRRHQYLDFTVGTRFRRTLLCRARDGIAPSASHLDLDGVRFFTEYATDEPCNPSDASEVVFRNGTGRAITSNTPALKLVLALLAVSPTRTIGVEQLADRFEGTARPTALQGARGVMRHMLQSGLAFVCAEDPPGCRMIDAEQAPPPRLTPMAREILAHGVVLADNANRGFLLSEPWLATLLLAMDGRHTLGDLERLAAELFDRSAAQSLPPELSKGVSGLIESLARRGVLVVQPGAGG